MKCHVSNTPTGSIVDFRDTVERNDWHVVTTTCDRDMMSGEIKAIIDFICNDDTIWVISGNLQQVVNIFCTADSSAWIVRINQNEEPYMFIHFGFDVIKIKVPSIITFECIFNSFCPIHLGICHVWRIVRTWSKNLSPFFEHCCKNKLQGFGYPVAHVNIVLGCWPTLALFIFRNCLTQFW